ncbi:DUF3408 domain-containing protein [Elizabethkingia anophelis]|uniref:DUF3408 domain-containing protein n=1 Tax=Elizabethkingia anophelis TaxID=1117645 RepID=UPI0012B2C9C5|nr:DUF3408 domain-containing protein [Elizabethkingia anophelis]QGN24280.1 DUF3408 domain-containing protein [Elizabethkingia anophelis]QNV10921.1 DUF3408 domain-containing protein [Elizabethkingia anophelis]UTF89074.1 DUF3408 domain-containing protein [Elizabethkingia anophelis]UTF99996.1 DUF3408 domain-containing protein [Elizabethkingia anophelis]UTG03711.1 DUF3408 domain-containing protein [Elizabethkingia anophelis]
MEKGNKKRVTPDINEELMMSLMVDGVKKDGIKLPPEPEKEPEKESVIEETKQEAERNKVTVREKSRTKRNAETDYESTFLKKSDTNARDGKTVYIRPEFHEKLTRIIQVIGQDKISIYAYLDNLLDNHFQEFGEQITKSYNDKYKPI